MKNQIMSCNFNIDTAYVEVKLIDRSMVSIDCDVVEDEYAYTPFIKMIQLFHKKLT